MVFKERGCYVGVFVRSKDAGIVGKGMELYLTCVFNFVERYQETLSHMFCGIFHQKTLPTLISFNTS